MDEPRPIVKATPDDVGCWVDGARGWHALARMVEIADFYGFSLSDEDRETVEKYYAGDEVTTLEEVHEIADEAATWLNENLAPDGYTFLWVDGDFCLIDDEELPE